MNIFHRSPGGNILEIFQGNTKASRCINLKLSGSGGNYHYDALPIKYENLESLPLIEEEERNPDDPSSYQLDFRDLQVTCKNISWG